MRCRPPGKYEVGKLHELRRHASTSNWILFGTVETCSAGRVSPTGLTGPMAVYGYPDAVLVPAGTLVVLLDEPVDIANNDPDGEHPVACHVLTASGQVGWVWATNRYPLSRL